MANTTHPTGFVITSLRPQRRRSNLSLCLVHTVCSTVQTSVCTPESKHSFWAADFSPPALFCRLTPALTGEAQGLHSEKKVRWRTQRTLQVLALRAPMGRSNLSLCLVHTVCSTVQTEVCTPESKYSFWTADFSPPALFCRLTPALTGEAQGLTLRIAIKHKMAR